jgi:3-oxoadipate enol-lactonase
MPIVKLPDVNLYYEWTGAEELPVLVFSNSLGTNLHMWDAQVDAFKKHFRILRYDKRGHGQSSVPSGPYSIEQLGWDVIRLLDILRLDQVCFCGLSIGGATGMFLGATAPKRFRKMALCNTAPKFGTREMWDDRIKVVQSGGMKAVASSVLERWLTAGFRAAHEQETKKVLSMLESANPLGYIAACEAVQAADMRPILPNIGVPCLVLAGTHDASATVADARFLMEKIPGAQFVEVSAAHISNIEARDDFNRNVLPFLLA